MLSIVETVVEPVQPPEPAPAGPEVDDTATGSTRATDGPADRSREVPPAPTWEHPDRYLLTNAIGDAPEFPLSQLGPFWANWCRVSAENANAPVDYVAGTLLATVGAMLGNVRWPEVEGYWSHPTVLWIGLVGDPSVSKSPGMRPVSRLIDRIEQGRRDAFMEKANQFAGDLVAADKKERDWKAAVEGAVDAGRPHPERPADACRPEIPVLPNLRVMDATTEAIQMIAAGCPRGLLQFSDELTGWFGGFDRYRGTGVSADRPFWLKAFDGDRYSISRKGQEVRNGFRAPVEIPHLSIGVVGGIQPEPLRIFLASSEDGLVHRFLWMWPERTATFKIPRRDTDRGEGLDFLAAAALSRIEKLDCVDPAQPKRIPLDASATDRLEAYGQTLVEIQSRMSNRIGSSLLKVPGLILRLSAVLTYLRWCATEEGEPAQITDADLADTIEMMDSYFLPQAKRVRQDGSETDNQSDARLLIELLRERGWNRFSGREIQRSVGGRLARLEIRKAACATLVEAGLLREDFQRKGGTAGRQQEIYEVNPVVFDRPASAAVDRRTA